jgi:Mg2+/citrate symporter
MSTRAEVRHEILDQSSSVFSEFLRFLADSKKWWLLPIVVVVALIALVVVLSGTGATPFIYSMD